MISTFGGFSIAKLGIRSSQQGLQVTGNNITNINTDGYTRQRINQISLRGGVADRFAVSTDVRIGMGSLVTSVTQIRDPFLDIRYRNEASNVGFYDQKMNNLEELKAVLDEVSKDGVHTAFEEIRTQLNNLASNVGSPEHDTLVRSACQKLVSLLNKYSADLKTQKENALQGFDQNVDEVNKTLTQIRDLNKEIRKSQIHGDNALELIDNRNMLIDRLSEMTKIKVTYSDEKISEGIVVDRVKIELDAPGQDPANRPVLIDGEYANKLEISPANATNGKPEPDSDEYQIHLAGLTNTEGDTPLLAQIKEQMNYLNGLTGSMHNINQQLADVTQKLTDWQTAIQNETWQETDFTKDREQKIKDLQAAIKTAREKYNNTTDPTLKEQAFKELKEAEKKLSTFNKFASERDALDKQKTKLTEQFNSKFETLSKNLLDKHKLNVQKTDNPDGTFTVTIDGGTATPPMTQQTLINGTKPTDPPLKFDVQPSAPAGNGFEMQLDGKSFAATTQQDIDNAAHKNDKLTEKDWYGVLKADLEYLNGKGEFGNPPSQIRGIAYYQRSLDTLAQTFANTMNELNRPLELDQAGKPQFDQNGNPVRGKADLFESNDQNNTKITASNISISKGWMDGSVQITPSVDPSAVTNGTKDNSNIHSMIQSLNTNQKFYVVDKDGFRLTKDGEKLDENGNILDAQGTPTNQKGDPVEFFNGSFESMFTNMNAVLGSDMSTTGTLLNNYAIAANDRAVARDNVSSVDLNEEGINLVQYQKSFAAACRVMTTLDEMLETLLSVKR